MHLYGVTLSPFVQRVLMAARAKGHAIDLRPPPGGALPSPEFQAISPMGRIPLLEAGDWRLCESGAIVAYLDETLAGPPLLAADPRGRAHARAIVSLAECEVAAGGRDLMVVKVFRSLDAPDLAATGMAQAEKGMAAIERARDPAHRFAAGDALGIADCLLVPLFALLELIDPAADTARLIAARPGLAAYWARMRADPLAHQTVREMTDGFAAMQARLRAGAVSS